MAGKLAKATLMEITWNGSNWVDQPPGFEVQFNPQSLKVNYANQKAGGEQNKGSPVQFVGKGTTKLSLELVFDITVLEDDTAPPAVKDVRKFTDKVRRFMKPEKAGTRGKGSKKEDLFLPPAVRFAWGDFKFDGVMDSVDETLDFWSEDGYPLRATLSISISQQEIIVEKNTATITPFQGPTGATEFVTPPKGKSLPDVGGKDYREIAAANGIENPRVLPVGVMLDLSGTARLGASARASLGLEAGASLSVGASLSGVGGSLSVGAAATAGISAEASAGLR
jgi:hypothetical protein